MNEKFCFTYHSVLLCHKRSVYKVNNNQKKKKESEKNQLKDKDHILPFSCDTVISLVPLFIE